MHETMVAQSLFEVILAESRKQNARPISAKITCGAFDAVNDEVLSFAFDAIAKDTACEGMKLEIEHKPLKGHCKSCDKIFEFELSSPKCSDCGGDFEILPDEPLLLETVAFESED